MPQTLACPHCQGSVGVADEDLGFHVTCPHCEVDFLAPALKPASTTDPSQRSLRSTSDLSTSESDQDDWLQLDEKPVSPKPNTNRDDQILAKYIDNAQVPDRESSSSRNLESMSGSSDFDDLELPSFVDHLPPANKPKAAIKKEELQEYRVTCKTCGTATYAKAKQAGRTIKCADCHSSMIVPPPPKVRKAPSPMPEPKALPMQDNPNAMRRPAPFQKSADQLLADAEAAVVETPPPDYDTPDVAAWFRSVFGIFTDSGVLVHWLAFSMIAAIPTYIAIRSEQTILIGALFPFAAIIGALIAACGFAILESVANEEDSVSSWPVFEPFAWLGQLFLVAAAAAVPLVPVAAVFGLLFGPSLFLVLVGLLAVYVLFPFVLLSMMDMDSPFVPFSAEVARSVTRCQEPWGGLYFSSGILFFALFLLIASVTTMAGDSGLIISITATVGVIFIYFAMIGRLAHAIGQSDEP